MDVMKKIIIIFALLAFGSGCAGIPKYQGVQGDPIVGMTRIKVGETSVMVVPKERTANGIIFVMEDGKVYWSKRFIANNEIVRLLENDENISRWVHVSPISENEIKKGDVILTCRGKQLYRLYF
jgi:hypothetical protein